MIRSSSVENKQDVMIEIITFGWTLVVSTNGTTLGSHGLSTLCFTGIIMRLSATSIYRMFGQENGKQVIGSLSILGSRLFDQADGLRGVGPFKSSLPRHQLNSSPTKASD
jgi:hypothetical protein